MHYIRVISAIDNRCILYYVHNHMQHCSTLQWLPMPTSAGKYVMKCCRQSVVRSFGGLPRSQVKLYARHAPEVKRFAVSCAFPMTFPWPFERAGRKQRNCGKCLSLPADNSAAAWFLLWHEGCFSDTCNSNGMCLVACTLPPKRSCSGALGQPVRVGSLADCVPL